MAETLEMKWEFARSHGRQVRETKAAPEPARIIHRASGRRNHLARRENDFAVVATPGSAVDAS
jgi:hypothetical protein